MRRLFAPLLLFLLIAASAGAEEHIALRVEVLEDAAGMLDLAGARRAAGEGRFRAAPGNDLDVGFSSSTYWLRLILPEGALGLRRGLLAVGTALIDRIDVYVIPASGAVIHHSAGDTRAFRDRAFAHAQPIFPVSPNALEVYVQIGSESSIRARPVLWREVAFYKADAREQAFLGVYFGIIMALLLYNLCLYIAVRDASFLFYVGYLGAVLLMQAKIYGQADQYLWPSTPAVANPATVGAIALLLIAGIQFARIYLGTGLRTPRTNRALIGVQLGSALIVLSVFVFGYAVAIKTIIGWVLLTILVLILAMVLTLKQGYRPARFLLYAFATLAIGTFIYIARLNNLLPSNLALDHALDLAIVAEAVLLSFALAYRINVANADKQRAEAQVLRLQRRLSQDLMAGQEEDRRRIAGELHDSIGQNLLVIGNRLKQLMAGKPNVTAAGDISEIAAIARTSVDEVRAIARDLRPHELDRLGFSAALRSMVDMAFHDSGIACETTISDADGFLPPDAQIHLYRVAQEAINNILKHSGANLASVRLVKDGADFRLVISDNGQGASMDGSDDGFGLTAMRERVEMIGGTFKVTSGRQTGTSLSVILPVEADA